MLVTMSDKELSRINVIQSVIEKRMRFTVISGLLENNSPSPRSTNKLLSRAFMIDRAF